MAYENRMTDRQKEHFGNCYDVNAETGCWIWNRKARHFFGYGLFSIGRYADGTHKQVTAHRLSYELAKGPIPDGLLICHTCDVPECVNPDHLYAGTQKDNMRDADLRNRIQRYRHPKGAAHCRAKLSDEDVAAIRASDEKNVTLARRYSVTKEYISRVRHNHERSIII